MASPVERYYGCLGSRGYNSVVKILYGTEAYIYNRLHKQYVRNDNYLKAMYEPDSEYEEISKEKAAEIIKSL